MKRGKKRVKVVICIGIFVVLLVIVIVSIFLKKANRQKRIDSLLMQLEQYYQELDNAEKCIDELGELNYENIADIREKLEYDKSVQKDVIEFYNDITDADTKLKNYSVTSMNMLMSNLKETLNEFDELPENENTELGQYIISVKNNTMYKTLKSQLDTDIDKVDFDYGLVREGYIMVFETYTDEILKIEFPYEGAIERNIEK